MIVGIDLGTTNSLVAYMSDSGPRLIPNSLGDHLTPSVVGIDKDGAILVGKAAREFQVLQPERCASTFKRHMGTEWTTRLGVQTVGAVELSSLVLKSLKADAEAHLHTEIRQAVITVPAYFNDLQRKATIRAGELAGLEVKRILNEPTAAAIAYGIHTMADEQVILVYDLGGGTFDVSIVERFEGTLEIRASAGEIFLGGEDFTDSLVARILETRLISFERAELEQPALVSRLRRECEQAKRQLTKQPSAVVRIPQKDGTFVVEPPQVVVTREEFDRWTSTILHRTDGPLRRAMGDASLTRHDLDEIILVGGATRMPAVRERIREIFQREPKCTLNPDEVVALGAAVQAGLISSHNSVEDLVVTDICPFTLGVEVSNEFGDQHRDGYFLPIINRNTVIPVSRVKTVGTLRANQTVIQVRMFQGEHRRVEQNIFLGEFEVRGVPPGPPGQPVDLRFTFDLNGVLEVEATIVRTGKKVTHVVTQLAKGMSPAEVKRALDAMQKLKLHPRENTKNRFLMATAERLYSELPPAVRDQLSELIHEFEGALESQDEAAIEQCRNMLISFLQQFDPEGLDEAQDSF